MAKILYKSGGTVGCHLTFNKQNYGGVEVVVVFIGIAECRGLHYLQNIYFTLKINMGAFSEVALYKPKTSKHILLIFLDFLQAIMSSEMQGGLCEITPTPLTPTVSHGNKVCAILLHSEQSLSMTIQRQTHLLAIVAESMWFIWEKTLLWLLDCELCKKSWWLTNATLQLLHSKKTSCKHAICNPARECLPDW